MNSTPASNDHLSPMVPPATGKSRWSRTPEWDGLADEQGPIPVFGPAKTDEDGRLIFDEGESVARSEAAIRTLRVLHLITDETDSDEIWDKASPHFEEGC